MFYWKYLLQFAVPVASALATYLNVKFFWVLKLHNKQFWHKKSKNNRMGVSPASKLCKLLLHST